MTTPLLRNRRHPGVAVASRLGRELVTAPTWLNDNINLSTSTVPALTLTAGGSAHTMGAWVEIVSSLTEDAAGIQINTTASIASSGLDTRAMIEIGIGGSGSEVVIVPGIAVGNKSSSSSGWYVPVFIPKGTRVAARLQHVTASTALTFRFRFGRVSKTAALPARYVTAIGANSATSSGVPIPVGASNNTKGAWTEITSATSERLGGFQLCVDCSGDTGTPSGSVLLDIGIGGSGSEVAIFENVFYISTASEAMDAFGGGLPICIVDIPKGTRIAARMQCSSTAMENVGVVVLGFPARGR